MVSRRARLTPKLFTDRIERTYVHDGYRKGLLIAGMRNEQVVAVSVDGVISLRVDAFADKFPERFFSVGVADQNMAAVASGLGISGKIVFISSEAAFSPGKNWDQLRSAVCFNDANVKLAGHRAGISAAREGALHQAYEDIALCRSLPSMRVFVPCDVLEAEKATIAASQIWGPVYIRLSAEDAPIVTTEETPFLPGQAEVFWESYGRKKSPQAAIIACGPLVHDALLAANELEREGVGTIVVNNHTIKPMDSRTITRVAEECGAVVSVEDHQVAGGMGSAVAEMLARTMPVPQEFVGISDHFGGSGTCVELKERYNIGKDAIKKAVKRVVARKKK